MNKCTAATFKILYSWYKKFYKFLIGVFFFFLFQSWFFFKLKQNQFINNNNKHTIKTLQASERLLTFN